MQDHVWCVVSTVDKEEVAHSLAGGSIRSGLAACAQVEGPVQSHYLWQGTLKQDPEYRITFKTSAEKASPLMNWIREHHPYAVPEILGWPAPLVNPAYRQWIEEE